MKPAEKAATGTTSETIHSLGHAVNIVRKRLKIAAEDFARLAGISVSMLYSIEQGRREPSQETRQALFDSMIFLLQQASDREAEIRAQEFKQVLDGKLSPKLTAAVEEYCYGPSGSRQRPQPASELLVAGDRR